MMGVVMVQCGRSEHHQIELFYLAGYIPPCGYELQVGFVDLVKLPLKGIQL